ncbi:MAG: sulfatase [Bryobacterales bacterium]|nr:sulfatase [Bryobacterales bacterium]
MTRRQLAGFAAAPAVLARNERPNILFMMTDDHVPRAMSCYGNRILKTPNFDRLAEEGCRFDNAFCTNSLCAPSRASVLTGAYSHINGIRGNSEAADAIEKIDSSLPTYPQVLQQAGYRTAMIGKWHLSHNPVGFDYSCILPGQGVYFDPIFIENGVKKTFTGYATDLTTDIALRFLRQQDKSHPWCLVYQHKAPHRPFQPAPRHRKLLQDIELPHPSTYDDDYSTRRIAKEAADMKFEQSLEGDYQDLPKGLPAKEKKNWIYQRFVKDFYRAAYGVDENLGRILDHLDRTGQAENTLIIYTSDNGFYLGEHGWYDKRFMYEPSLRLPLLIRYPALFRGGRAESRFALNVDYAPTMLDLAGVRIPGTMQGRSLRPLLEGKAPRDWRTSMYYTYYENSWALHGKGKEAMSDPTFQYFTAHRVGPHRGVRGGRYKLIHYYSEGDYWELFDLEKDPDELRNVYSEASYAAVRDSLKKEMGRLKRYYRDNS